ncbi:armadillo-type protein [Chytridium lagenaria]|nr:armadillo-type protein [Chytridium lagenaria]
MRWMESSGHPVVAIGVCGILIRLTHDERVLLNTFKLLFKLSKNERNDRLFQSKRVLGSILDFMRPSSIPESQGLKNIYGSRCDLLIYAAGTLKNISNNDSNQKVLLQCGCVPHLTEVIQSILDTGDFTSVPDDQLAQATQLLIQITASLRNLASAHPFVNGNAIGALINLTHESVGLTDSSDLMLNVSRILSKLSLHSDCLEKMKGESNVQALLQLVVKYQNHKRDPTASPRAHFLCPRKSYINIAALLGIYSAVCLHKLKRVATREGRRTGMEWCIVDGDAADEVGTRIDRENMDVMVKLVRVLANLALDPECGQELVQMIEIESLVEILAHADMEREEELVFKYCWCLANFTFYLDVDNCLLLQGCRILELLVPLLLCSNSEAVSEATRVFGNLSRLDESRQWMAKNKGGTELLIVLLDHSDAAVFRKPPTTNAAGKRVSGENGRIVVQGGGFEKIANVVEESLREEDLRVAIAASKALSNLFTISTSLLSDQLEDFISTNDEERLATILMHALESTMVKNADDDDELLKTFERIARNTLENLGYYEDEDGHALDETPPSTPPPMHPPAKRGNWVEAGVGPGS